MSDFGWLRVLGPNFGAAAEYREIRHPTSEILSALLEPCPTDDGHDESLGGARIPIMWQFKRAGIVVRMLIPVISVFLLGVCVLFFYIWDRATQNAVDSSVVAAKSTIGQYKTLRQYYTENVVAKAVGEGGMKAAYNHKGVSKTLPLPATMIHDLSSLMEADGGNVRLRLYSEYPFPNRKGRVLDSFARDALAAIQKDPSQAFVKTQGSGANTVVRVAIAHRLVNQALVNFPKARPYGPKTHV